MFTAINPELKYKINENKILKDNVISREKSNIPLTFFISFSVKYIGRYLNIPLLRPNKAIGDKTVRIANPSLYKPN